MGGGQTYLTFGTWVTRRMVLILKESRRLVRGAGLRWGMALALRFWWDTDVEEGLPESSELTGALSNMILEPWR